MQALGDLMSATFEHLAPHGGVLSEVPDGYENLDWSAIGVLDQGLFGTGNGYANVLHSGRAVAFAGGGRHVVSEITNENGSFDLKSGYFASAWNIGLKVKFTAFRDGVEVGHKTVMFEDRDQTFIKFGGAFKDIDTVTIVATGGTDADPTDNGMGQYLAIDDLKFANITAGDRHAPEHTAPSAHHDAVTALMNHAGGLSDWHHVPLM
jgi:hypothetical protein